MRFVVTGEWRENHLLRLILVCFLVYVALLWVTNAVLFFGHMSLWPSEIVAYYRGDEARFLQPRSFRALAEISHFHLFAMGTLLLTMTHLVLFAPIDMRLKMLLVVGSFASGLLDEASGWLIRFAHPAFVWAKILGFVGLQATLGATMVIVVWAVWKTPPNAYRDGARKS